MNRTAIDEPPTESERFLRSSSGVSVGGAVSANPSGEASSGGSERRTSALGPVLDLGRDTVRVGIVLGALLALIPHTYASVRSQVALFDMLHWVQESRRPIHDYFWTFYDIDIPKSVTQPKEEPPPPPPPELPAAQPPPKMNEDPYKEAPPPQAPAPAKADDIYNAKDDAQEPLAFPSMVDNDGARGAGYGVQSNEGKGDKPVTDKNARPGGVENGTGTAAAPAPPAAATPDKSRPPTLVGSTSWNCPFPAEADAEGRDSAVATIIVKVRPDGSPESVSVVADPGSGFGRAARSCALTRRYQPGVDRDGNPTTASTPPIRVRFSR